MDVPPQPLLARVASVLARMAKPRQLATPLLTARDVRPWSLESKDRHWGWSQELRRIASLSEEKLPSSLLVDADEHTYTIYDGYPKSQFHFLVLPRLPFKVNSETDSGSVQERELHPTKELNSISTLLQSPSRAFVLNCLERASERKIRASMAQLAFRNNWEDPVYYPEDTSLARGVEWGIRCGFHAKPSMEHLHMHVISSDLCGKGLKKKGHYLSFHPCLGYFVSLQDTKRLVADGKPELPHDQAYYSQLLTGPLISLRQRERTYKNMPALRQTMLNHWLREVAQVDRVEQAGKEPTKEDEFQVEKYSPKEPL